VKHSQISKGASTSRLKLKGDYYVLASRGRQQRSVNNLLRPRLIENMQVQPEVMHVCDDFLFS